MVIGNAGGGKSTLCRRLTHAHDLPHHELDALLWRPGWNKVPEVEFRAAHDALLAQDRWLIDGYGPWDSVLARLAACDTVVLLDHPLPVHLWWATKRQVRAVLWGREDGPPGCPMGRMTLPLYRMMWQLHHETRPRLIAAIHARADAVRIIHIRSPRQLAEFAANPV